MDEKKIVVMVRLTIEVDPSTWTTAYSLDPAQLTKEEVAEHLSATVEDSVTVQLDRMAVGAKLVKVEDAA